MKDQLIVKVLHFLGFYREFCAYIDKTETRAVRLHLKRQVMVYRGRTAVFE